MWKIWIVAVAAMMVAGADGARADSLSNSVRADLPSLLYLYHDLHRHPELSGKETRTAALLAEQMGVLGFKVTTGVGGTGVVAVMENGSGPVILLRTDMDALPVSEATGVSYASVEPGVMHACGHDIHMASWIGAARRLSSMKGLWSGTLVMIAQPAEEIGLGALAMLEDGLYTRFPKPDKVIALHDHAALPAGELGIGSGYVMANVDSVDLKITGVGGHGAYPQDTKDPILIGARIVTTLQSIISREIPAGEPAVITVGAFNGGFKHNIIPDEVEMQLTVRSFADATRDKLLKGIERIARAETEAAGVDPDKGVWLRVKDDYTPSLYNDPTLATRLSSVWSKLFPASSLHTATPSMGGEDFSRYGRTADKIPVMLLWLGAVPQAKYDAAQKPGAKGLPALHSSEFAPDPDPTLAAGVKAMTAAAIELLK